MRRHDVGRDAAPAGVTRTHVPGRLSGLPGRAYHGAGRSETRKRQIASEAAMARRKTRTHPSLMRQTRRFRVARRDPGRSGEIRNMRLSAHHPPRSGEGKEKDYRANPRAPQTTGAAMLCALSNKDESI